MDLSMSDYLTKSSSLSHKDNIIFGVFVLFLSSSTLTVTNLPRTRLIAPMVFLTLLVVIGVLLFRDLALPNLYGLVLLAIIYSIHLYHLVITTVGFTEAARIGIYVFTSAACILLLPQLIPKHIFLRTVCYLAAVVILLGLPMLIIGPYSILFLDFDVFFGTYYVPILGERVPQFMSFMSNPNPLGELAMFGLLATLVESTHRGRCGVLVFVCGLGLFLANSVAAILGTIAGLFIYVIWKSPLKNYSTAIVVSGVSVASILYLMVLQLLPAPEFITDFSFSGRVPIWQGAVDAIMDAPLLGHGPGDMPTIMDPYVEGHLGAGIYNSFLRMFVTTGIIGGLAYLVLFLYTLIVYSSVIQESKATLIQQPRAGQKSKMILIYSMLLGFVVNEMFSGNSVFGLSFTSIIGALLVGYALTDIDRATR